MFMKTKSRNPGKQALTDNITDQTRCAVLVTFIRSHCVTQEDMRVQLAALDDPSDEVAHLLGANQYVPRRTFPY